MNAAGDDDDGSSGGYQTLDISGLNNARVGELTLDCFEFHRPLQVFRRGNGHHDEWASERSLAQLIDVNSVGRDIQLPEVVEELIPFGELTIGANLEAE